MTSGKKKVLGFGSALLDVLANVEDDYLKTIGGEKGGMVMIDAKTADHLSAPLPATRSNISLRAEAPPQPRQSPPQGSA